MKRSQRQPTGKQSTGGPRPNVAVSGSSEELAPVPVANSEAPTILAGKREICICRPDQTPLWKNLLEVTAVLAGVCAIIIYGLQLMEAQKVTKLTSENFRASQRAWIGTDQVEIQTPIPRMPIKWQVTLKNFGNSPAMKLGIRDTVKLFDTPQIDATAGFFMPAMLPDKFTGETATVFNGQIYTNMGISNLALLPNQVDDVVQGRSKLFYIAEIDYEDIFGEEHRTHLCYAWGPIRATSCGYFEDAN